MTKEQKKIVLDMRVRGASYMQIASTIGLSENTVKSCCRRNIKRSVSESDINKNKKEAKIQCKQCGKTLVHEKKGQKKKFCCEDCRRSWWKSNADQSGKKAYYLLTCWMCGAKFESYGNKNRKFCGHACYIKKRYGRQGEDHDKGTV